MAVRSNVKKEAGASKGTKKENDNNASFTCELACRKTILRGQVGARP